MRYLSPLRYPGGKGGLAEYIGELISRQRPRPLTYVEPFAGGAGAALRLLYAEAVDDVVINDLDPGIAAFWRSVFYSTNEFATLIEQADVTLDEWHRQSAVYEAKPKDDDLALGFSAFFLNRTNRSGILNARPIGGLDQTGPWKIDARFNKEDLVKRVRLIGSYRNRVHVEEIDALELLRTYDSAESFVYVDPPYLVQGADLYLDDLSWDDHLALASVLIDRHNFWMVTYDADERVVLDLFPKQRSGWFDIAHTAAVQHIGKEYVVYSDRLNVSSLEGLSTAKSDWH